MKKLTYLLVAFLVGLTSMSVLTAEVKEGSLKRFKKAVKKKLAGGEEALLKAVAKGNSGKVRELLAVDVDPNASFFNKREPLTPLVVASSKGDPELVTLLLEAGANPNDTKGSSSSPLAAAFQSRTWSGEGGSYRDAVHQGCGNPEVIDMLLQAGADPNLKISGGSRPLFSAVKASTPEIITKLIRAGADPNLPHDSRSAHLERPLMRAVAVKNGNEGAVATLLAEGADPFIKDLRGRTALDFAKDQRIKVLLAEAMKKKAKEVLLESTPLDPDASGLVAEFLYGEERSSLEDVD